MNKSKLVSFLLLIAVSYTHTCIHDKLEISLEEIDVGTSERFLQDTATAYQPIRIYADYSMLESNTSIDSTYISNLKNIIDDTIALFQSFITVIPLTKQIIINSCSKGDVIPDYIKNTGVNTDLLVLVKVDDSAGSQAEAYAAVCKIDQKNKRPIAGIVGLSSINIKFDKVNWRKYFTYLLLHEFTHILVMSPALFPYFWDNINNKVLAIDDVILNNVNVNGEARSLIKTPKVVAEAKKHFNCDSLLGVEIENQGGPGSKGGHWESRIMLGDYMISASYQDIAISRITLALFEDSGWYKTNNYTGGLFKFGLNAGCEFLDTKCISNSKTKFLLIFVM